MNKMENKLAILINYRDRPTELSLLLQSLRTQIVKDFDIFILDDCSGTPITTYYFLNHLITRLKLENHEVYVKHSGFPHGVSRARQNIVDWALGTKNYEYLCRVDDDCILGPDYLDKLFGVIKEGYDLASGVTIPFTPTIKRNTKHLKGVINRVILDENGNFLFNGDDCGMPYEDTQILPAHHFRSCALYKSKVHEKVKYYPTKLSMNGFREEQIFSFKLLMNGFKIGVNTSAINYHLMTPSGGERNTMNMVPFNQQILEEFTKENKDKLISLTSKKEDLELLEYNKENNLLMR